MPRTSAIVPLPLMGINSTDSIAATPPEYARSALNYFGTNGAITSRKCLQIYSYNIGNLAKSCFELALQNGNRKLISIGTNGVTYDSTAGGAAPTDISGGNLTNAVSNAVTFRNYIFMKSQDTTFDVYRWDGVAGAMALPAFVGPGLDDKALFSPNVYKSRLYFLGNDLSVWYGAVDQIGGAPNLTQFDFQSIFRLGGVLYFAGGTTKQAYSDQQYFVAVSSQGEILLYQGDSPSATNWGLLGVYYTAPPCGRDAFFYWGANLVLITKQGVVLLSEVLNQAGNLNFLSEKINSTFPTVTSASGIFFPKENMLVIKTSDTKYYIMNTITGGWWQFQYPETLYGMCLYNGDLYFAGGSGGGGAAGVVFKANVDSNVGDELSSGVGTYLKPSTELKFPFNYFNSPFSIKQFTEARLVMTSKALLSQKVDIAVDYAEKTPTSNITISGPGGDAVALFTPRCGLTGQGKAGSLVITNGTVNFIPNSILAAEVSWTEGGDEGSGASYETVYSDFVPT